jgi:hypothetical protein
MTERTSRTLDADAPLSSARKPDPAAAGLDIADDDAELVGRTVTINRPRQELYDFWRDFRHLPTFMENIEDVIILDDNRSHWIVQGPAVRSWNGIRSSRKTCRARRSPGGRPKAPRSRTVDAWSFAIRRMAAARSSA